MSVLHPCLNCHRRGACDREREVRRSLRGSPITVARFKCSIPQEDFPLGARVRVLAFHIVVVSGFDTTFPETYPAPIEVCGIVTNWRKGKVTVSLDRDQEIERINADPISYLHAYPRRLTRIGADVVRLCSCGNLSAARCVAKEYPRQARWTCAEPGLSRFMAERDEA